MPAMPKVNNGFRSSLHQVRVNGNWKVVPQIYVKNNSTWKPVYSYSWRTGSWSKCSVECGGGIQTRTVTCKRNDDITTEDYICNQFAGSKPSSQTTCNTQSCYVCKGSTKTLRKNLECFGVDTSKMNVWDVTTLVGFISYAIDPNGILIFHGDGSWDGYRSASEVPDKYKRGSLMTTRTMCTSDYISSGINVRQFYELCIKE